MVPDVAAARAAASWHAVARGPLLAVAADDQQRVVDPGAEAEHHRDQRGEGRQAERSRQRGEQDLARRHAERARRSSVAAIAAPERNSSVSSTIAISTPIELADRRVLLGGEVDQHAARLDLNGGLGGLAGGDQRLAVLLLDLRRVGRVAHVDRRQAPVLGDLAARLERARRQLDAVELADLRERALDRRPRLRIGDLALVDREDERRVGAAERRRVRLEEVDRLLGLGPGSE